MSEGGERDGVESAIRADLAGGELAPAATLALRSYGPAILTYLFGVLRDASLAEEVFGDFSEQLWRGIGTFRGEGTFRAWSYGIAWHTALRALRDPYRRRGRPLETKEVIAVVDEIRTATPFHLRTEGKDAIEALRQSLEPDERALLILRLERKLSWAEVARALCEENASPPSEAALRKRFERIKTKLRELAERKGLLAPR